MRQRRRRDRQAGWEALLLAGALLWAAAAFAQEPAKAPSLEGYRPEDRKSAEEILKNATFQTRRRMTFRADVRVFQFFIEHPDFAAAVNRGLGHEKFHVRPEKNHYRISHGYARGIFWPVERKADRVAYLAKGTYEHPLFSRVGLHLRARSYVVETIEGAPSRNPETPSAEQTLSIRAYLYVENPVPRKILEWIGPLVRWAFEAKLTGAYRIAPELSEMAYEDGAGFLQKVRGIEGLDPDRLRALEDLVRGQPERKIPEKRQGG
ncbi:MAG: hypothetical protein HYY21_11670 [Candidatus Tectomicrobia bacterium]|nr:hypothetical protein [Candidatus Tectomicrobia bacterium]